MRANYFSDQWCHTRNFDPLHLLVLLKARRGYYEPEKFHLTSTSSCDTVYPWQTKLVAHHFCFAYGCHTFSDSPAFEPDGSWDKTTRRTSANARLFDNFDAALMPVDVIDGKNLWYCKHSGQWVFLWQWLRVLVIAMTNIQRHCLHALNALQD